MAKVRMYFIGSKCPGISGMGRFHDFVPQKEALTVCTIIICRFSISEITQRMRMCTECIGLGDVVDGCL